MTVRSPRAESRLDVAALAVVVSSVLALVVPVVLRAGFPAGHDATAHLTYTYLFDRAIAEGHIPVRWIEWVRAGHGQPLFNFYQPGFFYLVQLVHLVVPSLVVSMKVTVLLLWWCGTAFVYLFLRRQGPLPAAAGAIVFAFSPYLVLDVFVRSAYPELAGIVFATGVLWALDRCLRAPQPSRLVILACLTCLMLISHAPVSLIFGPVFIAYAGYLLVTRQATVRTTVIVALAALLGVGLAAFYLLPAIAELHLIKSGDLTASGFDFHQHFVLARQWTRFRWGFGASVPGAGDGMSFQIGIVQWLAIAAAVCLIVVDLVRRRAGVRTVGLVFWLMVLAGAMSLMTRVSVALWEAWPALAFVQFPWRFLMLVSVAGAALASTLVSAVSSRRVRVALVIAMTALLVHISHGHLVPVGYITPETMDIDWWDWRYSSGAQKTAFLEKAYFPTSLEAGPGANLARWTIVSGDADVREVSMKGHALELEVSARTPSVLRINSPDFPGWTVWVDDVEQRATRDSGYPAVSLKEGVHRVRAAFSDTALRARANGISAISAVTLLCAAFWSVRRARPTTRPGAAAR